MSALASSGHGMAQSWRARTIFRRLQQSRSGVIPEHVRVAHIGLQHDVSTSDWVAIVDDTADGEFGHLGMRREQCIHALRRTFPTRCEAWHRFMTLEVLAADRKHDQHGDHHPCASVAAAIASTSYHPAMVRAREAGGEAN
jgi:hypothetical protein